MNSIGVDGAAVLVGGWQHKSMLRLNLRYSLGDPHESALRDGKKCCSSCDHLLELYYKNDYMIIYIDTTESNTKIGLFQFNYGVIS